MNKRKENIKERLQKKLFLKKYHNITQKDNFYGIYIPHDAIGSFSKTKMVNMGDYGNLEYLCRNSIKSDISHKIGLPINIIVDKSDEGVSNQIATYFTTNLKTRFGDDFRNSIILFRTDGVDLDNGVVLDIHDYICHVSNLFSDKKINEDIFTKEYYEKYILEIKKRK